MAEGDTNLAEGHGTWESRGVIQEEEGIENPKILKSRKIHGVGTVRREPYAGNRMQGNRKLAEGSRGAAEGGRRPAEGSSNLAEGGRTCSTGRAAARPVGFVAEGGRELGGRQEAGGRR